MSHLLGALQMQLFMLADAWRASTLCVGKSEGDKKFGDGPRVVSDLLASSLRGTCMIVD